MAKQHGMTENEAVVWVDILSKLSHGLPWEWQTRQRGEYSPWPGWSVVRMHGDTVMTEIYTSEGIANYIWQHLHERSHYIWED